MSFACACILPMYAYLVCMWVVYTCMSSVCHSYVLVCYSYVLACHPYITRMYSYVIRMSLVCTRMSSVCHSYVLVCHSCVTRMYSYVIRISLICGFTMKLLCSLRLSFWVTVCFSMAAPWVDGIGEIRLFLIYDQMISQQVKFRFGLAVNLGIALRENLQN